MKTTREKADELVSKHYYINGNIIYALKCAIISVKHTIEVLESLEKEIESNGYYERVSDLKIEFEYSINEQTELLTELESRL